MPPPFLTPTDAILDTRDSTDALPNYAFLTSEHAAAAASDFFLCRPNLKREDGTKKEEIDENYDLAQP